MGQETTSPPMAAAGTHSAASTTGAA